MPANQTAGKDLSDAMDNIFNYPSVGPFVCKQLIEHLVKSNPSPQYIQRVVTVFGDDGSATRGNLQAVIKAILMDPEARAGDFQVFPTDTDPKEGHLREPVLRIPLVHPHRVVGQIPIGVVTEVLRGGRH